MAELVISEKNMSVPPPPTMMWTATATQPPFTVAQWQELEHQALIFKYLKAGLTVPPDLLVPIRKSLQLMSHHPSLGYCASYYGKKIDPEPGRCRRTDGKKWRCSRDAHPDSKYCERHMIRRRYRSRKPVESQSQSQSQPAPPPSHSSSSSSSSSSSQSHFATGTGTGSTTTTSASASASAAGTFHTLPLHTNGAREGCSFTLRNNTLPHLQMDPLSFAGEGSKKEYRFGLNSEADEHNFLQKDLGSVRYQGYDFTSDGVWSHMSQIPSNTVSESRSGSTMVSNCFQQRTMRDAELLNLDAARSKELVFSGQLSSAGSLKQEYESPQSLFSDWHWKKDLGSSAIEYKPNKDFNCNPDVNVDCSGSL